MGFWDLDDKEDALPTDGKFDANPPLEPIPDETNVIAALDSLQWEMKDGDEWIKGRWCVLDGTYKNRKITHNIKVLDADTKRSDKALKMLAAIDANAGGVLSKTERPSDSGLSGLTGKPMLLKLRVWEIDGNCGNWVCAVSAMGDGVEIDVPPKNPGDEDWADDIDF